VYLVLNGHPDYGTIDPFGDEHDVLHDILHTHSFLALFESYPTTGMRPIFLEGEEHYSTKVLQVARKIVEANIPYLVPHLGTNHFRLMHAILGYLSQSGPKSFSQTRLCTRR
jgi:hypothetical protein